MYRVSVYTWVCVCCVDSRGIRASRLSASTLFECAEDLERHVDERFESNLSRNDFYARACTRRINTSEIARLPSLMVPPRK